MSYIYKIENLINHKVYIGKTSRAIEERWSEHCKQFNQDNLNRPLYSAMKKYGVHNFNIEILEECSQESASGREIYWINAYNSYYEGYNATLGGEGRPMINTAIIYELFYLGKTVKEIVELTGYSKPSISKALDAIDENKKIRLQRGHQKTSTPVMMLDKDTNKELAVFDSANQATLYCKGNGHGHILEVCKGKRKTAYGYKWKFLNS